MTTLATWETIVQIVVNKSIPFIICHLGHVLHELKLCLFFLLWGKAALIKQLQHTNDGVVHQAHTFHHPCYAWTTRTSNDDHPMMTIMHCSTTHNDNGPSMLQTSTARQLRPPQHTVLEMAILTLDPCIPLLLYSVDPSLQNDHLAPS